MVGGPHRRQGTATITTTTARKTDPLCFLQTFDPPLPPNVSFHLFVSDAALVVEIRTLEPQQSADEPSSSYTGFSIRDRLTFALGGARAPAHDEADRIFKYKGQHVRVKEKIRVESQDPALISASAKLNALEHDVMLSRNALNIVMNCNDDDDDDSSSQD